MITKIMKMIAPMMISPPPTNCPNVSTTLPGEPVVKIRRVEETLSEIRKIVVNSKIVGKFDISRTSLQKIVFIRMINATEILSASITSSIADGIGTMKNTTAARI